MGSGKSRGKRIAPANETDAVNNDSVKGDGNSKSSAEPFRVRASTSLANKNTQLDCHPEGQHSEWSTDLDGELEEILAEADEKEGHVNKDSLVKKRFFSSKTFGLCNYIRVRDDQRVASTHQLPNAGLVTGSSNHAEISVKEKRQLSNKPLRKTSSTSTHHQQGWSASVVPETQSKGAALAPDTCAGPSLDKSVILYDATEEDLMKTIEREFN